MGLVGEGLLNEQGDGVGSYLSASVHRNMRDSNVRVVYFFCTNSSGRYSECDFLIIFCSIDWRGWSATFGCARSLGYINTFRTEYPWGADNCICFQQPDKRSKQSSLFLWSMASMACDSCRQRMSGASPR